MFSVLQDQAAKSHSVSGWVKRVTVKIDKAFTWQNTHLCWENITVKVMQRAGSPTNFCYRKRDLSPLWKREGVLLTTLRAVHGMLFLAVFGQRKAIFSASGRTMLDRALKEKPSAIVAVNFEKKKYTQNLEANWNNSGSVTNINVVGQLEAI